MIDATAGRYTLAELARRGRCARSTVQRWFAQFVDYGVPGLLERRLPTGRKSPMAHPEVLRGLKAGLGVSVWRSVEEVANWLNVSYGIKMKSKSVRYQLRRMGLPLPRPHTSCRIKRGTGMKIKSPKAFASKQRRLKTPELILSHDTGSAAAVAFVKRRQANLNDANRSASAVEVWLAVLYELLERGELSLAKANECVARLREEWRRYQEAITGPAG